ncbi:thio(seleno)oxazole modification radical SAM maturase SbtM [Desulfurivibrio dismutans]|uniref:thio(seleno)oxazole modification radical SAM maturase SbtM n=1 Tax=Desulfurivibrio dismutans TaxID=1398908 RepID=UPI0023DC47CC|nr:thio(seleno)oxazole modification radical SAM maturase SbtM [Desulfurivibrio alkaliphilus]MDF1615798.1 thio(seleno)oxazole modification radical SAM maturase SbtM [Desulfurivibrio alkaliphilus]
MNCPEAPLKEIFPACRHLVGPEKWGRLVEELTGEKQWPGLPEIIGAQTESLALPPYLAELAKLEAAVWACRREPGKLPLQPAAKILNPSLRILNCTWRNLASMLKPEERPQSSPTPGAETLLVWLGPRSGQVRVQPATDDDLLALKIIAEKLPIGPTALEHGVAVANLHRVVEQARNKGLILAPEPLLIRDQENFVPQEKAFERFVKPRVFTLQWHITQACDLNCKHCYDRSSRQTMSLEQAFQVLDQLESFCAARRVRGKVTFTGGNPLLYPHFDTLYLEAVKRGFPVSILGNPASRQRLEKLVAIQAPTFYQVSLEGLPEHNDFVRQAGYFNRVLEFLPILKELGIFSQVMLTLTRDNMAQVLPLGEILRDKADLFTFNRLSAVGEGARLLMPDPVDYQAFLREYMAETANNPVLGLKDNLINIIREQEGRKPFGGCTGFGCGAGFNFLTLLSDGELHACRKFPSFIGNIYQEGLAGAYDSPAGRRYRAGSAGCRNCKLLQACGGCQAVIFSSGLDPARDRDPYCFYAQAPVLTG